MEENKQENKQQSQGRVLTRDEIKKYAKASINIPIDAIVNTKTRRKMLKKYDKEAIQTYLENPQANEAKLREIIDYLCTISPQFCQLIRYIPDMNIITPFLKIKMSAYNEKKQDKAKKDYYKIAEYADSLEMKKFGDQIIHEVYKYGVFFGLEYEGTYSTYVKKLNPNYCKIIAEGEAGYKIAFDFSFFDNNEYILDESYPKSFRKLYNDYKAGKVPLEGLKLQKNWQPIDVESTFVVKFDTTNLLYSIPPYINIFSYIYDLEDYKDLNKAKVTADNYTMIGLKIPQISNSQVADQYSVSSDMIDQTCIQLEDSLPEYMGYFTTPMDITTVKASSDSNSSVDNVANAVKNLWGATGKSEVLFGIESSTQGTLSYSVQVDENELFSLYKQLENHWNYKIKKKNKNFTLQLLETTQFNINEKMDMISKQAQLGLPVSLMLGAMCGLSCTDLVELPEMQDMMGVYDWKPLQSAYQQSSSSDEDGRPKKSGDKDDSLTESGEKSRNYTEEK